VTKVFTGLCGIPLCIFALVFFPLPSSQCAAPPAGTVSLKVMTWNIQFGEGTDAITNYDRTAATIAAVNPDVVGLCEVPSDSASVLQTLLSQKTGRTWFTHFVPKYNGTDEGNLILSWRSFASTNSMFLSASRSVAQVTINIGGQNVNFFATHLDDQASSNRVVEVGELKSWAANFAEPRVISGDFNGGPDTSEALAMTESYSDSWSENMSLGTATAYPDNPVGTQTRTRRGRIDYIFHSSANSFLVPRAARIPDTRDLNNPKVVIRLGTPDDAGVRPSDHNFVVAEFDLNISGVQPTPTPTPTPPPPTPTPTPIPTPTPLVPHLLTDPVTGRALALESTIFTRDPFPMASPLNLGSDKRTRVILFCTNVVLFPGETSAAVTARGVSPLGVNYDLPVEYVGQSSELSWLAYVIVRLPDDPSLSGSFNVNIVLHGLGSNSVTVALSP